MAYKESVTSNVGKNPIRKRADFILLSTGIAYAAILVYQLFIDTPVVNAAYWCLQSAFIGSVADWFAVTALFERPLGITFHTALLPSKKHEIIESIVKLVNEQLIRPEKITPVVAQFKIIPYLDRYLTSSKGRHAVGVGLHEIIRWLIQSKTPEEWSLLGAKKLQAIAEQQHITPHVRHLLLRLCDGQIGSKQLLDTVEFLQKVLYEPEVQSWLYSFLSDVLEKKKPENLLKRFIWKMAELTNIVNVEDLRNSVTVELDRFLEEWKQPDSELRRICLQEWRVQILELSPTSPSGIVLESVYVRWLRTQNLQEILLTYVWPYIEAVTGGEQYDKNKHVLATSAEETLHQLWLQYRQDIAMQNAVEEAFQKIAKQILSKSDVILSQVVRGVLGMLSDEEFNRFIRPKVEEDLSWIRINGALVGGCIGLAVWAVLFFIYEPLLI